MEFRPAWSVDRFVLGKFYFVLNLLLYLYFLDFVLYEYSSFSSSQKLFLHFGTWKNHSKLKLIQSYFGDQNLVNLGTQHGDWGCLRIHSMAGLTPKTFESLGMGTSWFLTGAGGRTPKTIMFSLTTILLPSKWKLQVFNLFW